MAAVIANEFGEASGTHRAALIGLGVVLFVITILVNVLARAIVSRSPAAARAERRRCDRRRDPTSRPGSSSTGMSRGRAVRNGLATAWMIGSVVLALIPLVFVFGYVVQKGLQIVDWEFLTEDIPIVSRSPAAAWTRPSSARCVITFWAAVMAVPLGDPRRDLPHRVRRARAACPRSSASSPTS